MTISEHDVVVIGAGPGGYVAAIRAAQLGMNVAVVEKEAELGGTCLRIGCIPSKALLESSALYAEARNGFSRHGILAPRVVLDLPAMMKHKESAVKALTGGVRFLFEKNHITRYEGRARIAGPGRVVIAPANGAAGDDPPDGRELHARHVIIATGSEPAAVPGIDIDEELAGRGIAGTSTDALSYPEVPGHLVVIGGGAIGLELGSVWLRLGSRVTVIELLPRLLAGWDARLTADATKILARQGFEFRLNTRVTAVRAENGARAGLEPHEVHALVYCDGAEHPLAADRVLVAVGRRPYTRDLGLDRVGIELDAGGRIPVDENFRTRADGFYAIGDVIAGPMLAHKAEDEGIACVEAIATGYGHVNYDAIPNIVYTHPEIASVGRTEESLREARIPYRTGSFPFRANGRARALGELEGTVRLLAHAETDRLLGAHIVGPRAGDLIAELAMAIEFGASSEDIARTSHAHPTLAEVVREAAFAVSGRAIHI